jgi:hypothetical protein
MGLVVFLLLSVVMAISVGFLASLWLRAWLKKSRKTSAPHQPVRKSRELSEVSEVNEVSEVKSARFQTKVDQAPHDKARDDKAGL